MCVLFMLELWDLTAGQLKYKSSDAGLTAVYFKELPSLACQLSLSGHFALPPQPELPTVFTLLHHRR